MRQDLDLCILHWCQCSSPVDACVLHSFVCRRAPGRSARHHALARSCPSAGTLATKESTWLFLTAGKRLDETLVPWQSGQSLCWVVTVTCPLSESYVTGSTARQVLQRSCRLRTKRKSLPTLVLSRSTFLHLSRS